MGGSTICWNDDGDEEVDDELVDGQVDGGRRVIGTFIFATWAKFFFDSSVDFVKTPANEVVRIFDANGLYSLFTVSLLVDDEVTKILG